MTELVERLLCGMRGETNQAIEEQTKEVSSLELKTRGLLQEWSDFLSNLSDSQKVKLTFLYIAVMLIIFCILIMVFYVLGKYVGEVMYFLTN